MGPVIYLCVRGQLGTKTEGCDQQPNKHVVLRLGRVGVHRASIKLHLRETDTVPFTPTALRSASPGKISDVDFQLQGYLSATQW